MSKKKICFIAQFPPPIHGLSKAVDTLYNSESLQKFELEKVDITNNKLFFKNIIKICKSKADVFYFTISQTKGGNLRDLIILKLLAIQKKKCLVHLHGGYYRTLIDGLGRWQKAANYKAIKKIAGAIVLGDSLKWIFEGMLEEDKIYTVPNCVDNQYLMDDEDFEKKKRIFQSEHVKHVLYLSNFIRSKGYREVLQMASLEKERVLAGGKKEYHFDFAGKFFDDEEKKYFNEYITENKLDDYVSYHGVVSGNKKQDLLFNSDIFVLLTTYPNEGQPISILEAMGNGALVVTTNHAGIQDVVDNGVNGLIFDKSQMNELPKLVYNKLISVNSKELICKARQDVINNYLQESYIENMKNVFCITIEQ